MKEAKKKAPAKHVWRIFKFSERFEPPDSDGLDPQKPLPYMRQLVGSGHDDISVEYFKQIQDLRLCPDYMMLKGVFLIIMEQSANRSITYRGYLLDGNCQPATNQLIGLWTMLDAKAAGAAMKKLAKVGLIERVPMPDFDKTHKRL